MENAWITNPVPATTQARPQKERKRKAKEDHGYRSRDQRPEDDGDDESDHEQHRSSALEDLSPRKRREAGIIIPLSSPTTMSPMRRAAKRSSDSNSTEDEPTYKRARTTAPLSSPTQSSAHPRSSSPPPVRPASRSGHTNATRARSRSASRGPEERATERYEWEQPGYATKQRVLEKLEAERIRKELEAQARRDRPETFVPEYLPAPKPAQRTITPTVTQPFTFQSDARAARPRHDEFDSRRQLWEDRIESAGPLTSSRSSSRAGLSAPSSRAEINVPDFAAIHASNAAALASKRPKINPTVPSSRTLNTASRARDRERYDAGAKEREEVLEDYRRLKRRERELVEKQEYLAARRRAVPKAKPVPDWYADAPKRR